MEQVNLPELNQWADVGIAVFVGTDSEAPTLLLKTQQNDPEFDASLFQKLRELVGVSEPEQADGSQITLISVFHRGHKVGAVCQHTLAAESDEAIRDVIAAILANANQVDPPEAATLDPKEIAYLKKVQEGLSDAEIAEDLSLSLRAVKERKKRTLVDLGAVSIAHAIAIAVTSRQI